MMAECPICGGSAEMMDRTGDWDGYDCAVHGQFRVGERRVRRAKAPLARNGKKPSTRRRLAASRANLP